MIDRVKEARKAFLLLGEGQRSRWCWLPLVCDRGTVLLFLGP